MITRSLLFRWGAVAVVPFVSRFWRGEEDLDRDRGSVTITAARGAFTIDRWRGKVDPI